MIEYTSISTNEIVGRGRVFVVKNDRDRDRHHIGLHGEHVKIDGVVYTVKGVEYFHWRDVIPEGQHIGLLVNEV
jgi:hypothetical protein